MMDCERSCLRIAASFLLGVGLTLTFMVVYPSADFNSANLLEKLSFGNGTVNVPPKEVALNLAKRQLWKWNYCECDNTTEGGSDDDPLKELAEVLRKAANQDNTVILTQINDEFSAPGSLLDLFLESFHAGEDIEHLLNNLVMVSVDQNAHNRCKSRHPHCFFFRTEGTDYSKAQPFMSKDYLNMMWLRFKFQLSILKLGFNFLFTDVDILWFRDPFRYIYMGAHIAIACDKFYGDPYSVANRANGGFLYTKSCNKTIELYKFWHAGHERFPGKNEQDVIELIKTDVVSHMKVRLQFLDTAYIGTFCQLKNDLNKICTLHANCCVGLNRKNHDLKIAFQDWKNFTAKSADNRRSGNFHWKVPVKCKRKGS